MLPNWLKDFLSQNPYPSLSFLPMLNTSTLEEEIAFFYQAPEIELRKLEGDLKIGFNFYEEKKSYIMRMEFYPVTIKEVKTPEYVHTRIELEYPYVETEFFKNVKHEKAMKLLKNQEAFRLYLYDRHTKYISCKKIGFTQGRQLLKETFPNI